MLIYFKYSKRQRAGVSHITVYLMVESTGWGGGVIGITERKKKYKLIIGNSWSGWLHLLYVMASLSNILFVSKPHPKWQEGRLGLETQTASLSDSSIFDLDSLLKQIPWCSFNGGKFSTWSSKAVVKTCVATCECQSLKRGSLKSTFPRISMDFPLEVASWTHVAEGGVNMASGSVQPPSEETHLGRLYLGPRSPPCLLQFVAFLLVCHPICISILDTHFRVFVQYWYFLYP